MVTVIHPNDDPEKSGNFRHTGKLGGLRGIINFFRRSSRCHMEWRRSRNGIVTTDWFEFLGDG